MTSKKRHRPSMAAAMDDLPHGLVNFGHELEVDLEKKDHRLLIAAAINVLPGGSGNFGHDHSWGIFDENWENF